MPETGKTIIKKTKTEEESDKFGINPDEMMQAGLQFGHKTSKTHPKMKPYLAGVRNSIQLFDLEKTAEKIREALKFIQEIVENNKIILFVGTKIQHKNLAKEIATETGFPYVSERWLGGTITNFSIIKNRVDYYKDLEKKKETGELEKYTKKEQLKFGEEIEKLRTKFEGIKQMAKIPDVVFVLDIQKDMIAVREAKKRGIKVIGICDTNIAPDTVDCPIPANDDAILAVKYILDKAKGVILEAKEKASAKEKKEEEK